MNNSIKWYEVYGLISEGLFRFYEKHGKDSGQKLFQLCMTTSEYITSHGHDNFNFEFENSWIKKFQYSWGVQSIDPVHVFASFNYFNIQTRRRINLINFYFAVLRIDYVLIGDIDFSGIPSPRIDNIVGARPNEIQEDIWELFYSICLTKINNQDTLEFLESRDAFNILKKWFGLAIPSFTIFLFWIDSDTYLPLDGNTRDFLKYKDIKVPTNIYDYVELVRNFEFKFNFESKRELVKVVYEKSFFVKEKIINFSVQKKLPEGYDSNKESIILNYPSHTNNFLQSISRNNRLKFDNRLQIIAVRPLFGCNPKFFKILKDQIYLFSNLYKIDNESIVVQNQQYKLYDIDELKINLNVIAGKNGTGKSTIIELLIASFNNIAKKLDDNLNINYIDNICLELYIFVDKPYKLILGKDSLSIKSYKEINKNEYIIDNNFSESSFQLDSFFYTILLNYSLHGLNEKYYGDWLYKLFHKNDAYQTPVVIEPFRKEGNIDVNKQMKLVKSRVLSNLLEKSNDNDEKELSKIRRITNYQYAKQLNLSINFTKLNYIINEEIDNKNYIYGFENFDNYEIKIVLEKVFSFFNINVIASNFNLANKYESLENIAKLYLFKKIIVILFRYTHYSEYYISKNYSNLKIDLNKIDSLLARINNDKSHITYKIKQTINFLKYINKYIEINDFNKNKLINMRSSVNIDLDDISDKIYSLMVQNNSKNINEFIIPSFFEVEVILNEGNSFETLSSGEQQMVYVSNSILYHLKNISSVDDKNDLIKYQCVNIILEEIELYFHPDMQRKFINTLLSDIKLSLERTQLEYIKSVNIFFITHSPFILTDIPSENLMLLDRDNNHKTIQVDSSLIKTFGSNIHELLSDGFFLENTIGEFSYNKIQEMLDFLNNKNNKYSDKESVLQIIMAIGEPFLREKFLELYERKFLLTNEKKIESIDFEINKLKAQKKLLENSKGL